MRALSDPLDAGAGAAGSIAARGDVCPGALRCLSSALVNPELQHELQKLNGDLAAAAAHLPNPLVRGLALAIVARLVKILYLLAEGKHHA